jgi:hypothetical protein
VSALVQINMEWMFSLTGAKTGNPRNFFIFRAVRRF